MTPEALDAFLKQTGHESLLAYLDPSDETPVSALDRKLKWASQHRDPSDDQGEASFLLRNAQALLGRVREHQESVINDEEGQARFGQWYPGMPLPEGGQTAPGEPALATDETTELDPAAGFYLTRLEDLTQPPPMPRSTAAPLGAAKRPQAAGSEFEDIDRLTSTSGRVQVPKKLVTPGDLPVVHSQGTAPPVKRKQRPLAPMPSRQTAHASSVPTAKPAPARSEPPDAPTEAGLSLTSPVFLGLAAVLLVIVLAVSYQQVVVATAPKASPRPASGRLVMEPARPAVDVPATQPEPEAPSTGEEAP